MKRQDFNRLIDNSSFAELFITEMGWNNPSNKTAIPICIDEDYLNFMPVADKKGFHVYSCTVEILPSSSTCKKIDNKLKNYGYDYICIFILNGTSHHLWLTPIKANEKRELVKTEYINGAQAEFLYSKIDDFSFDLTEQVLISDVKSRVHGSFQLNSEKITKDFYAQFRKEHTSFKKHIEGIDDDKKRDWYTSVMLNRLMFCYFIQKKGFLDQNTNYLQDKLRWVKENKGDDQFFGSFYKGFLCAMFHEGLNHPRHDTDDFVAIFGRIPYLNGGMFDDHQLEREYTGIDIPDEAFENLFNFFDKWNWHLDTRLTSSGKDINPDVLGYIFEQYINDRAAMGAYYTKEDITEYIGKNCILPFLMDKTQEKSQDAFKPNGEVWRLLSKSGDRYIFDAVKKGYSEDWRERIPDYIAVGLDTTDGTGLLERRSRWNERTHADFALPTEIWRETIERLLRCESLLQKIGKGEIAEINDFITYNLDIRLFAEDVLRNTSDHLLVGHFYHALQNVTILDPTCGSGAFLFAALNILEPLYEVCIDRMEEFHTKNPNLFKLQLEEIEAKYSSNRQYFIYKSIILRNLYGVDIMAEATEIAKLRLFLKMVAVVEVDKRKDNLGLDPLPDIDFNIKYGNTLVGYATERDLEEALQYSDNLFASEELRNRIFAEMKYVATAYACFRSEQLKTYDDNESIKKTKHALKEKLSNLNDLLNHKLFETSTGGSEDYTKWLESHQPFHWLAEFYQIIKGNGGFDVIIGNPPYVEYNPNRFKYRINGVTRTTNLFAVTMTRASVLLNNYASFGMIVLLSLISTDRMSKTLSDIEFQYSDVYFSNYEGTSNPGVLFNGVKAQLTITIARRKGQNKIYSTHYNRFYASERDTLFHRIKYAQCYNYKKGDFVPKTSSSLLYNILCSIENNKESNATLMGCHSMYYRNMGNFFWKLCFINEPLYRKNGVNASSSTVSQLGLSSEILRDYYVCFYNSSLHFMMWNTYSDCYHFNIKNLFLPINNYKNINWNSYAQRLMSSYEGGGYIQKEVKEDGTIKEYYRYFPQKSKPIIDEIDKVLAKHYGFTDEELDFIINYDIKYRMGDELEPTNKQ